MTSSCASNALWNDAGLAGRVRLTMLFVFDRDKVCVHRRCLTPADRHCLASRPVQKTPLPTVAKNGLFAATSIIVLAVPATMCFQRHPADQGR